MIHLKSLSLISITKMFIALSFILVLVSCNRLATTSSTKIAGGKHITSESSETIKGVFPTLTDNSGLCTATAVSHNTAITASHCFDEGSTVVNTRDQVTATKAILHPQYKASGVENFTYDVALLIFPDNTFSEYFSLKPSQAQVGDDIFLVGYSPAANDDPSKGNKRWGRNTITHIEGRSEALISISQVNHNSVGLTGGDSGGPLFVDCEIAGVASRSSSPDFAPQAQEGLHTDTL